MPQQNDLKYLRLRGLNSSTPETRLADRVETILKSAAFKQATVRFSLRKSNTHHCHAVVRFEAVCTANLPYAQALCHRDRDRIKTRSPSSQPPANRYVQADPKTAARFRTKPRSTRSARRASMHCESGRDLRKDCLRLRPCPRPLPARCAASAQETHIPVPAGCRRMPGSQHVLPLCSTARRYSR